MSRLKGQKKNPGRRPRGRLPLDPLPASPGKGNARALCSNRSATRKELRDWCQSELARFKIPRYMFFVQSNEWPLTGSGKIQKFQLREKARKLIEARVHG